MIKEKFIVEEGQIDRVDKFLAENVEELSRSELKGYFDEGKVLVNNKVVKPSFKLSVGDEVILMEKPAEIIDIIKENIPLEIVYEDDDLLVVNKPSGMVVHPAPGHPTGTLVNAVLYHCNQLSDMNGDNRPGIVHRIDKDTSGLLIVCKNNYTHRHIAEQLKNKTSVRKYVAIVTGSIGHNLGKINAPIGRDPDNRQKMAVVENGKEAVTHFKVLDRYRDFTLIELRLETGRTHQIRVHMSFINHPVLGDPLYGVKKQVDSFGQYLHAQTIGFVHPRTNEYMEFSSELPIEFQNKIEELTNK